MRLNMQELHLYFGECSKKNEKSLTKLVNENNQIFVKYYGSFNPIEPRGTFGALGLKRDLGW